MGDQIEGTGETRGLGLFEKYLYIWVILCILAGILLGKVAPGVAKYLDGLAIYVGEAPVVSIPIAICLFFMMYPIMVKIDFAEVVKAGKSGKPVFLTLFVNWAIKPFTMYAIALFFLGTIISLIPVRIYNEVFSRAGKEPVMLPHILNIISMVLFAILLFVALVTKQLDIYCVLDADLAINSLGE